MNISLISTVIVWRNEAGRYDDDDDDEDDDYDDYDDDAV